MNHKQFAKFLMENAPMTQEVFNFLVWWEPVQLFTNLAIAPLYRTMVTNPATIDAQLGPHRFKAEVDRPVLLVPQDCPECPVYGVDLEELTLGAREDGSLITVDWYRSFEQRIEPQTAYKIDKGSLYKKVNQQWQQVKLN
ncbi:MAG: hypothetical protein EBU46_14905 [Nitrosomonadaceae bacterium]|nr:hypothetical protein [Nitrosomonadaceae bacterium]